MYTHVLLASCRLGISRYGYAVAVPHHRDKGEAYGPRTAHDMWSPGDLNPGTRKRAIGRNSPLNPLSLALTPASAQTM